MSSYLSEEEQVEALKKWWKENGTSVIIGVVLGFGIIFGWQGWNAYQVSQGEGASILYTSMDNQLASGDRNAGVETAKRLVGEFGGTAYATFAALQLAQLSYTQGEKDAARSHLQWAMDNAPDKALSELARLRLANLLMDMQQWEAAGTLVNGAGDMMAGEFALLRGEIARQQGDADAARAAYREALDKGVHNEDLVRMKLVDSGDGRTDS